MGRRERIYGLRGTATEFIYDRGYRECVLSFAFEPGTELSTSLESLGFRKSEFTLESGGRAVFRGKPRMECWSGAGVGAGDGLVVPPEVLNVIINQVPEAGTLLERERPFSRFRYRFARNGKLMPTTFEGVPDGGISGLYFEGAIVKDEKRLEVSFLSGPSESLVELLQSSGFTQTNPVSGFCATWSIADSVGNRMICEAVQQRVIREMKGQVALTEERYGQGR